MLDRYAVQKLVRAGVKAREVARQLGISLRSVRRIARESLDSDTPNENTTGSTHPVGRPRVTVALHERVRAFLKRR